jgi:hypothetical protein
MAPQLLQGADPDHGTEHAAEDQEDLSSGCPQQ